MNKGVITNEYNEIVGKYWYDIVTNSYTIKWHDIRLYGFTENGLKQWALNLDYYLEEKK